MHFYSNTSLIESILKMFICYLNVLCRINLLKLFLPSRIRICFQTRFNGKNRPQFFFFFRNILCQRQTMVVVLQVALSYQNSLSKVTCIQTFDTFLDNYHNNHVALCLQQHHFTRKKSIKFITVVAPAAEFQPTYPRNILLIVRNLFSKRIILVAQIPMAQLAFPTQPTT